MLRVGQQHGRDRWQERRRSRDRRPRIVHRLVLTLDEEHGHRDRLQLVVGERLRSGERGHAAEARHPAGELVEPEPRGRVVECPGAEEPACEGLRSLLGPHERNARQLGVEARSVLREQQRRRDQDQARDHVGPRRREARGQPSAVRVAHERRAADAERPEDVGEPRGVVVPAADRPFAAAQVHVADRVDGEDPELTGQGGQVADPHRRAERHRVEEHHRRAPVVSGLDDVGRAEPRRHVVRADLDTRRRQRQVVRRARNATVRPRS